MVICERSRFAAGRSGRRSGLRLRDDGPGDEAQGPICGYGRFVATDRDMSYPRHEPRPLPSYPPGQPGQGRPSRPPRPPLTKRMRPGHWIAVDYAVGALAALLALLVTVHVATSSVTVQGGPGPLHTASVALVSL